ncbi:MAG: zinc-dependent metalloprotease [Proteobacteria bacterium]|nr:zinc-dependent metalloprotease [Pseudomonadota bacterium]
MNSSPLKTSLLVAALLMPALSGAEGWRPPFDQPVPDVAQPVPVAPFGERPAERGGRPVRPGEGEPPARGTRRPIPAQDLKALLPILKISPADLDASIGGPSPTGAPTAPKPGEVRGPIEAYTMIVREDQLDVPFLMTVTVAAATGDNDVAGMPLTSIVFKFRRTSEEVLDVVGVRSDIRAEPGSALARAIERDFPGQILTTLPIFRHNKDAKYYSVPAMKLFAVDVARVSYAYQSRRSGERLAPQPAETRLIKLQTFPTNDEVQMRMVYQRFNPRVSGNDTPLGYLTLTLHYSILLLPSSPGFEPRRTDDRVGYFASRYRDLSSATQQRIQHPMKSVINRWNLEKIDPAAAVSDVKNPIVYWIDETVPEHWRDAVRKGVLAWNAAFEAIGFRNAVQVKEVDKHMSAEERARFDPANAAYNVVRWFVADMGAAGVGPSRANPFTGELYNATVLIGDLGIRAFREKAHRIWEDAAEHGAEGHDHSLCLARYAHQARWGLAQLEAKAPLSEVERERFLSEFMTWLTMHEVGHTLALTHNFKGGSHPNDAPFGSNGKLSASVMHYPAPNVAAAGNPQQSYYQTEIGDYDKWAIAYGYSQLPTDPAERAKALDAIARRAASDPRLAYAADMEAGSRVDPDALHFSLGRDPVEHARHRVENVKSYWRRVQTLPESVHRETTRREDFETGFDEYWSAAHNVLPVIGGIRSTRLGHGDVRTVPVSGREQRKALEFLDANVLATGAFDFPPEFLRSLGQTVTGRPIDVSAHVGGLHRTAMNHVFSPAVLQRLSVDHRQLGAVDPLTPTELFERLRRSIWKEVLDGRREPIGLARANLQRLHVEHLVNLSQEAKLPRELSGLARRHLERVGRDAKAALKRYPRASPASAHLEQIAKDVEAALKKGEQHR